MAIQIHLLGEAGSLPQALRTRLDLLLGHYILRGENRRKMELADSMPLGLSDTTA
jgi:hypothetical protein